MTHSETPASPRHSPPVASKFDRRRFLASLGVLAGGGALLPLLGRPGTRRVGSVERVEAGRPALGTWMRVVAVHGDRRRAQVAIEAAFAAVRRVDALMSIHRTDSQLHALNVAAGRTPVAVDPDVRTVVELACRTARLSDGVYDPTILPLMRAYGFYGADRAAPPSALEVDHALACVGFEGIRSDRAAGTLELATPGAGIDLGSIGKGWAVDQAAAALQAAGVRSGLVDLGGNVYGLGAPDDAAEGWSVGVMHPATGRLERVFVLRDRAVATSGNSEQTRTLGAVRIGHLFDARRGTPANGHLSASVVARSGVESDVMSTAAFLLGPDRFRDWPGVIESHFVG